MGIKNLFQAIVKHAPSAISGTTTQFYVNQRVAVDASVLLYQFLTTIVKDGQPFVNAEGQVTSHILGLIPRCTRFAEAGIKPIFVFDGAAGEEKSAELNKRKLAKEAAQEKVDEAIKDGDILNAAKYAKRSVRVTPEIVAQAKKLIHLLGLPVVQAPGEAEIYCVALVKNGLADVVASSDLDCVCHGAARFVRNLATDKEIVEISYEQVLKGFEMTENQFVDYCILMGCDYCPTLPSVGPKRAFELILEHKTIEDVIASLGTSKVENYEEFILGVQAAREVFLHATETCKTDATNLKVAPPNEAELIRFLVGELEFDEKSAHSKVEKYVKARKAVKQATLAGFIKKLK